MGKIEDTFESLEKRVAELEKALRCCDNGMFGQEHICQKQEPPKHDVLRSYSGCCPTCKMPLNLCTCGKPKHDVAREPVKPGACRVCNEYYLRCECKDGFKSQGVNEQEPEDPIEKFDPQCFDAKLWADEFIRLNKSSDHGTMHAWFASAIMAGFDEARRREPEDSIRISRKDIYRWLDKSTPWVKVEDELRQSLSDKKSKD